MVPSFEYTSIAATAAGYTTWGGYLTSSNSAQYKDNSIPEKAASEGNAAFFVVPGPELDPEKLKQNLNTMVKTNQFSATVQYVTPSCKAVEFRTRQTILAGSLGSNSADSIWSEDGDDVNNYGDL